MATEPTGPKRMAVTRADVARHAGVSPAVVSYVLNDSERPVSSESRARVLEAIRILGYRPNAVARALRRGSTRTIGLLLPDSSNPLFAELSREIEFEATRAGYALILANSRGEAELEIQQLHNLIDRQVDGLVVISAAAMGPRADQITALGVPCVVLDRAAPLPGVFTAGVDFARGSEMAVAHLLSHGHRSVAAVLGDDGSTSTIARERGWAAALRVGGAAEGPTVRVPFTRAGGYEGGLALLRRGSRPSAVFVSSDLQAVGLLKAAHELGIDVPRDLAVIAFDGSLECEYTWPPLSVVRQPIETLAEIAMRAVVGNAAPEHISLEPQLLIRSSCGCVDPLA